MTAQQELIQALRAILDDRDNPLPNREQDPVNYLIQASDRAERDDKDLSPLDKELGWRLFQAAMFPEPLRISAGDYMADDDAE